MKNLVLSIAVLVLSNTLYGQYDHNIHFTNGNTITHNEMQIDSISFSAGALPVMHLNLMNGSTNNYALSLINQVIFSGEPSPYPTGTLHCISGGTAIIEVFNPETGKVWMDRNLGAAQAASVSDYQPAYGDLYQCGRFSDGHQCRTTATTNTISSSDAPGHQNFILAPIDPWDWRNPQNNNLWQGVNGLNNPCPQGFRIPTEAELDAERASWPINSSAGAFASSLKLPAAGSRSSSSGELTNVGSNGFYWSSTVSGPFARFLYFSNGSALAGDANRAFGFSVRCLKDLEILEGSINSLGCASASITGTLTQGAAANEVSVSIPYTGGNGVTHSGQTVQSTGVGGLTATLSPGTFANGNGTLTYTITGTPQSSGMASFAINIGGQTCTLTISVNLPAGTISSLNCGSATISGTLIEGVAANEVSVTVPYTGGNGGIHNGQAVSSTGVSELTATLAPGIFANGSGTLSFTITGTPQSSGTASFAINIGGQMCTLTILVTVYVPFPSGTVHCIPGGTAVIEIFNPTTGQIWMDRNLGASQTATASNDPNSYGDLYQWGRFSDGHQCRNSDTTSTNATTEAPNQGNSWDGKFIIEPSSPEDWIVPQNDNLWQGVMGINNPCPDGYRIPTEAEWLTWGITNSITALGSDLKLPAAGVRSFSSGGLFFVGLSFGFYWSSTVSGPRARRLQFDSSSAYMGDDNRASGDSVRCIKD